MAKFAVYYIPSADSTLYQRGSELLGYDIRAGYHLPKHNVTRTRLGAFEPTWIEFAQIYGFHVTTAGTYEYDEAALSLDTVIAACDVIFNSFDPANPMQLTAHPDFVWHSGFVGLRYEANFAFQTLHTALCTYMPQFGQNSRSLERLREDAAAFGEQHQLAHRTRHFFTPYIFDSFMPHFTLLNPFPETRFDEVREGIMTLFADMQTVTVESLCLVCLPDDATFYEIVHEFRRADYPQAFAP